MKKILCFGDSNTYGYIPGSGKRYDKIIRWTGVLQTELGMNYTIIEAGCNNRTAFCENPAGKMFTGIQVLNDYLYEDLEYIILFIGINDTQFIYNTSLEELQNGIEKLVQLILSKLPKIKIILLSPPRLTNDILNSNFSVMFDTSSIEKSSKLSEIYKKVSQIYNCEFIDLNKIVSVSSEDGLHLEPEAHKKIAEKIKNIGYF